MESELAIDLTYPECPLLDISAGALDRNQIVELSERIEFNMHDAYYEHATAEHFWIQWRFEVLQELLSDHELGKPVFEVGCGNGVVQKQFEQAYSISIDGCDLNYRAMEMGTPSQGTRYLYNVLDQRLEWKKHFESILLLDTLEHIDEPVQFLQATGHHLAEEGLLVINVPAMPMLYSRYDSVQGHAKRYTVAQLESELTESGFKLHSHRLWGGNLVPIALLRKQLVKFAEEDEVLTKGFAAPGKFAEGILRTLKNLETRGCRLPWCGTSLAAIAIRQTTDKACE